MEEVSEAELGGGGGAEAEDGAGGEVGDGREGDKGAEGGNRGVDLGLLGRGAQLEENEVLDSGGRHGCGGGERGRGGAGAEGLGFREETGGSESDRGREGFEREEHLIGHVDK